MLSLILAVTSVSPKCFKEFLKMYDQLSCIIICIIIFSVFVYEDVLVNK